MQAFPLDSSMGWGRCHKPCPSAIPNTERPRPIHWPPSLDPMLPQQWSNPDYCYLEPSSRVKPEQPHQMAVSTNHNLDGCVIQLTSHLSDVENYRGFQGYRPCQKPSVHAQYVCIYSLFQDPEIIIPSKTKLGYLLKAQTLDLPIALLFS